MKGRRSCRRELLQIVRQSRVRLASSGATDELGATEPAPTLGQRVQSGYGSAAH